MNETKKIIHTAPPSVSVIIPTLNAGFSLSLLLDQLTAQSLPPKQIIIIDSESSDQTQAVAHRYQCTLTTIARQQFDHGLARNAAASLATGEYLVFLTQDVECVNDSMIANLIGPLAEDPRIAVCYGRHVPKSHADPIEHFLRKFNYPVQSRLKTKEDITQSGLGVFFCSNCCSAIRRSLFGELGGFKNGVVVNEDILFAAAAIHKGYGIYYNARAQVYHSHNYSISQLWRRYYLIGRFFAEHQDLFSSSRINSYGQNLFGAAARYFWQCRRPHYLVPFAGQLCLKAMACKAGGLSRRLFNSGSAPRPEVSNFELHNYEHTEVS